MIFQLQKASGETRPVWFVFAGMGTQWQGMGRDLMCIEAFHTSIMRSDKLLKAYSIDLYDLLMTGDENTFNDTLNSFISIAAIQVSSCLGDVSGCRPDQRLLFT